MLQTKLSRILGLAALVALTACQSSKGRDFGPIDNLSDVDRAAEKLKAEILNTPSDYVVTGKTYYVSQDGSDDNDGLSEKTPFKSLDKINGMDFQEGDAVLFRRGDLWRGQLRTKPSVSYSAYGTGPKPRLYRSPCNAAQTGSWTETDKPGVYAFSERYKNDVGTLVFDDGDKGCAYKIMQNTDYQGNTFHLETGKPFNSYQDMERDLDMYHDPADGTVYLYSLEGNPAERFKSIELLLHGHCVIVSGGGTALDNLCIKYTGSHGIGAGSKKLPFLKVTNCEIGWIGGSIQHPNPLPTGPGAFSHPTRFGNGVELWGGCDSYTVSHNYVYQCYDAGITHQFKTQEPDIYMENVTYSDNLVERCVYAIEYFFTVPKEYPGRCSMDHIRITDNILRLTGTYSWGYQRPDKITPAAIKAWSSSANPATDFVIEHNIIDRGDPRLLDVHADQPEWMPVCRGNIFLQQESLPMGTEIEPDGRVIWLKGEDPES